jgi:hypothetical protein
MNLEEQIRRIVRDEIATALRERAAGDLVAHADIPVPRRVSCAAAATGAVAGARKVGRRWLARRAAWDAWLDREAAQSANVSAEPDVLEQARRATRRVLHG